MLNTCSWIMDDESECGERCEGNTPFCGSHNRQLRREEAEVKKQVEKRTILIAKQREKAKQPRKTISKNPKDWNNTFLCGDGARVTQAEINQKLRDSYALYSEADNHCKGCGAPITCHAHIIPQARCKNLNKAELIWNNNNWFASCFPCNSAIENPKGKEWKRLKNIEKCLSFIKQHDPELYTKFELSAVNQERETI